MRRILQTTAAILLPLGFAVAAPSVAQQLLQPVLAPAPATSRAPPSIGPRLNQPPPAAPATVPTTPDARPARAPIRDTGPANEEAPAAVRRAAAGQPAASTQVVDAAGVGRAGYIQVAPNRVYNPSTNRYHWTVRSGGQQKIVE